MPKITIPTHKIEIDLPQGTSLTELDNYLLFGCRLGVCGACVIEVVSGRENLSVMEHDEKEFLESLGYVDDLYRLACQCKVLGKVTIKQF